MHDNQLDISPDVVRTLVDRQFPQWRSLPVRHAAGAGTVNAIFRIGDLYAARFPLKAGDVDGVRRSLEAEAKAAAELAGRTRFRTPEPIAIGEPGAGYPLPWSVQTWLPGTVATDADPGDSAPFAVDLAEFIVGVRSIPALGRTFSGRGRGGDLHDHDEWLETCFVRSAGLLDVIRLRRMWAELRDLPRGDAADVMNHGDLMPGNVLVSGDRRRLAGVLDVGGLEAADPALDLVGAWHLLEAGPREALRGALGSDDLEWARGKAWAFQQSMGLVWYYADSNPAMAGVGRRTLDRLIADERPLPAPGVTVRAAAPGLASRSIGKDRCRSVPAVLLLPEVVRLLAGESLGLVAVQVAVAVIGEVLVDLRRGEAGQHLLAEFVMLDDALALSVMLVHAHRGEAGRARQQLMRDLMMGPPAAVDLVVGFPRLAPFKKSHAPKSSPVRGRLAVVAGECGAAGWRVQRRLRSLRLAVFPLRVHGLAGQSGRSRPVRRRESCNVTGIARGTCG
jgi:aminoglycoside phosphotransferase (APT) family kinase protein